jgi:hypothetical protein
MAGARTTWQLAFDVNWNLAMQPANTSTGAYGNLGYDNPVLDEIFSAVAALDKL